MGYVRVCRWMTFCPEWLTGSPNLNTANWLHFWVYLVVGFAVSFNLHHIIVNIIFTFLCHSSL
jgi:hypothetical protein